MKKRSINQLLKELGGTSTKLCAGGGGGSPAKPEVKMPSAKGSSAKASSAEGSSAEGYSAEGYSAEGSSAEGGTRSAAETVGRALLDRLGASTGLSEDRLAELIIKAWDSAEDSAGETASGETASGETAADKTASDKTAADKTAADALAAANSPSPVGQNGLSALPITLEGSQKKRPLPIKSGSTEAPATDYTELSDEQFKALKRQLQKATSDGRRVRL